MKQFNFFKIGLLLFLISPETNAQKVYLGITTGLGAPVITKSITSTNSENISATGSFGKGFSFGLNIGSMINQNVGVELTSSCLIGGSTGKTVSESVIYTTTKNSFEMKANQFRLIPAIKLSTARATDNLYIKVGAVIGVSGRIKDTETYVYDYSSGMSHPYHSTGNDVYMWKGGIGLGFSGSVGYSIKTGNSGCFFSELCFIYQTWAPKRRILTEHIVNGENYVDNLSVSEKETDFVNDEPINPQTNPDIPTKEKKISMPMSAIYFFIGYEFNLGKKEKLNSKPNAK